MAALSVNAQDKQWQRESDANTLAEAEEIKIDKGRLGGAKKEAKVMAKRDEKRANAMKKVAAGNTVPKKSKPPTKRAKPKISTNSNKKTPLTTAKNRR